MISVLSVREMFEFNCFSSIDIGMIKWWHGTSNILQAGPARSVDSVLIYYSECFTNVPNVIQHFTIICPTLYVGCFRRTGGPRVQE